MILQDSFVSYYSSSIIKYSITVFISDDVSDYISWYHSCFGCFGECCFGASAGSPGEVDVDVVDQLPGISWQLGPRLLTRLRASAIVQPPPAKHCPSSHRLVSVRCRFAFQ